MNKGGAVLFLVLFCMFFSSARVLRAAEVSTEEMAGAMLMVGFRGLQVSPSVLSAVKAGRLGGVILFDRDLKKAGPRNIVSAQQVKSMTAALQAASPRLLLIAVDQEGGRVRRLKPENGFFDLPSAEVMGGMEENEVRAFGLQAGREMAELGINADLAPVVDVRRTFRSPGLGELGRIFSPDARQVSKLALAFSEGLYQAGVLPALKHFPGLGSADRDSHHALPDITGHWNDSELLPYAEAFRRDWPGMVLVAHIYHRGMDPRLPSSLSPSIVEGLLRGRLGWDGVVISDDLQMGAVAKGRSLEEIVRLAIEAGNDILLFGNNLNYEPELHQHAFEAVMKLVRSGIVKRERLERSWKRIEAMKRRLGEERAG